MSDFKILDNLFEPIVVVKNNGEIVYVSHSFIMFIKRPPRIIRNAKNVSEFIPKDQLDVQKLIEQSFLSKTMISSKEVEVFLEDNTSCIIVVRVIPYLDSFLICINDVSVEKVLYNKYKSQIDELCTTHEQIMQADKLRSLGELTAGIGHEINNPLTIISGNTEILGFLIKKKNLEKEREQIEKCLEHINNGSSRIKSIILNMKEFLHQSEEKKEYVLLEDVLENSMNLVTPSYKKDDIELKLTVLKNDIISLVNKIKLEQVVVNLLQNSLDAVLESKGEDENKIGEVEIVLGQIENENKIYIDIIDNGVGIAEENKKKIFETFFTTKGVGLGTGLGLSISYRIIDSYHGELKILDSNIGAHFRIELPCLELSSFTNNETFLAEGLDKKGVRVLVIDNEPGILNLCDKFMESTDFIFIGSTNGADALKIIDKIEVDIIVTDYLMPVMGGKDFVKKLRAKKLNIPVLYMSTKNQVKNFQNDKEKLSISGMIVKPFTQDEFLNPLLSLSLGIKCEH